MASVAEQDQLAQAHITGQQQIRTFAAAAVAAAWTALPHHDEANVPPFLNAVVPVVAAAQRASVTLTEAYLARSIGRQPVGVNVDDLIGSAVRNGTPPAEVYRRPFVTVWSALKDGKPYTDAVHAGLARATTAAETDVQLSMRAAVTEIATRDKQIFGYERVPDPGACPLCLVASTQRYHKADLLPIHPHCGCGIKPITDPEVGRVINRALYTDLKKSGVIDQLSKSRQTGKARQRAEGNRQRAEAARKELATETVPARRLRLEDRIANWTLRAQEQDAIASTRVAVAQHGELGPLLVDAADHFTALPASH